MLSKTKISLGELYAIIRVEKHIRKGWTILQKAKFCLPVEIRSILDDELRSKWDGFEISCCNLFIAVRDSMTVTSSGNYHLGLELKLPNVL